MDNPGSSNIAEARPALISGESRYPANRVAETSVLQGKETSGIAQESAATISEETRFFLSIANQSDFRLEKTRPVPMPSEFLHLEQDLDKISALYKSDNFAEAKENAIAIVKTLPDKSEAKQLIQYLNSVIFLAHIMQDMTFCHDLPATDSAGFVHWMLTIAEIARQESDDLPANSKLMLFCLRWAADSGDQGARQYLVKVLLFRQLCPDMPSPDVHFFPAEALEHLVNMARDNTQLPEPGNNQEDAINRMVELIKLRNTENSDSRKKKLVDFLRQQSQPEIQLLIPFIYTSEVFGPVEYDKARAFLEQLRTLCDQKKQVTPSIGDVYQFWELMCTITHPECPHATIETLSQLAQKGFLAAIYLLCELFMTYTNISEKCITSFLQRPEPHFSDYPSLVSHLNTAMFYTKATSLGSADSTDNTKQHHERMKNSMLMLSQESAIQPHSDIRNIILYRKIKMVFTEKSLSRIGRETISALPVHISRMLVDSQYTRDPAVLIYLHCAQVLEHGQGDEKLIETAERINALSTYFHMLMMSDATVTMDRSILTDKLLDLPDISGRDFFIWKGHPGLDVFAEQLKQCANLCRNPEKCYRLCLELYDIAGTLSGDRIIILTALAEEKILQGKHQEANNYYEQAWMLEDPSQRQEKPPIVQEGDHQVRRLELPEHYQQLASIGTKSAHPLEVQCRFNLLMSVWNKVQESKDPSLWSAWAIKAYEFVSFPHWHVDTDMCHTLMHCCKLAIEKQQCLSHDLLCNACGVIFYMMSSMEISHDSTPMTELEKMGECLIDERGAPLLATGNDDNMAKLSGIKPEFSYITQHPVIVKIQAARSFDDIIRHLKELTTEHEFDPTTVVRKMALLWPGSEHAKTDDMSNALLLLRRKLDKERDAANNLVTYLKHQYAWVLGKYCQNFGDSPPSSLISLMETREQQETGIFTTQPDHATEYKESEFNDRDDDNLLFWSSILHASRDESEHKFDSLLLKIFIVYPPRLITKILHNVFITNEQCILKLEQLRLQEENIRIQHILKFFTYQIAGQQKEMMSFIKKNMKKTILDDDMKNVLLWCAYESSLVSDSFLAKQIAYFPKDSGHYNLIGALTEGGKYIDRLNVHIVSSAHLMSHYEHYWSAVGFKLLSLGKLDDAVDLWSKCQSAYPLAMLAWHHGIQPQGQTIDIREQLMTAAKNGQVKAQCELIHWLLKREKDGEKINFLLKQKSCRFVHAPTPIAGAESVLYQGITQYLGFGCEPDPMTGKQKIQEALDKDPLIVALRLYNLKEQKLFALHDDPTDYLLCYAQALSKRDKDPYNRRDNYFNNLLLSYGSAALQKLLTLLHGKAESDLSNKPVYRQAAHRLGEWLGQWSEGTASPASAPRETSRVTVSSANASRRTSRATASSTKTSSRKSKGTKSPASASHKTSRVAASATSAPPKTREESTCTEEDVRQVMDAAMANDWKSGTPDKINQLANRLRREKAGLSTETGKKIDDELHTLLTMMPGKLPELAKCADAVINLIRQPEKIAEVILSWIAKLSMALSWNEQAFCLERILTCFPEDHSINLDDHKADVLCFLELLMQHQPIPEKVAYLLDTLSEDERTQQLLIKGFPGSIDTNPKMYRQHVETAQPPDPAFVNDIWRALKPESDAKLIRAVFTALIKQKSPELHAIKADDGRLKAIDLYNLFSDSSLAERETLLDSPSPGLRELLVKSYLQFRKANPGKRIPLKHLEGTIRESMENNDNYSIKRLLEILIIARKHSVDAELLQNYCHKIKDMASRYVAMEHETIREQQDNRLIARAILYLIP